MAVLRLHADLGARVRGVGSQQGEASRLETAEARIHCRMDLECERGKEPRFEAWLLGGGGGSGGLGLVMPELPCWHVRWAHTSWGWRGGGDRGFCWASTQALGKSKV